MATNKLIMKKIIITTIYIRMKIYPNEFIKLGREGGARQAGQCQGGMGVSNLTYTDPI